MPSLLTIDDLDDDVLAHLVVRGAEFAEGTNAPKALLDKVVGIYFRKTSTRTRTAFSAGALRLGAQIVSYGPNDLQENTGETAGDTAAVLSGMLDVLVARTAGSQAELESYAAAGRMSVVNAMSEDEHPTQALTDLTTLHRRFGAIDGLRVLYVGEGNNTASALTLALSRFAGVELHLRTPYGYGVDPRFLHTAEVSSKRSGAKVIERHDMRDLPGVDVVYTTRWQTTGTSKPDPHWRTVFAPFQVDDRVFGDTQAFMHDLPAHRGEEVTASVLDGERSIAFAQAENKFHSARAVLEWCVG